MKQILLFTLVALSTSNGVIASTECRSAFAPYIKGLVVATRGREPLRFEYRNGEAVKSFSATVADFMTKDGYVFLFRTITASKYVKNFGSKNPFEDQSVGYSYSLDPEMPLDWTYFGDDTKDLILVAVQSVSDDNLTFPEKDETGKVTYLNLLTSSTLLSSIAFYDEVKNPKSTENVIGVLRKKEFRAILERLFATNYSVADVASSFANHPMCISP